MIVYLIIVHNDPDLFKRLVARLLIGSAYIFVHVDRKANLENYFIKNNRVFYAEERLSCSWGGVSIVKATLILLKQAIRFVNDNNHNKDCKFVLLSGQCYPIKRIDKIERMICEMPGSFIKGTTIARSFHHKKQACGIWWFEILSGRGGALKAIRKCMNILTSKMIRIPPIPIYYGSQWWVLDWKSANAILNQDINKFLKFSFFSLAPDEFFFHSLLCSSSEKKQLTEVVDISNKISLRSNIHYIDDSLSKYFNLDDFDVLSKSNKLFVRKVASSCSNDLLDELDKRYGD